MYKTRDSLEPISIQHTNFRAKNYDNDRVKVPTKNYVSTYNEYFNSDLK